MNENKFLNDSPEQVILIPRPRTIRINGACAQRAYGIFDSETGIQVSDFKKGTDEQIEFADLDPGKHYDVGVIEGTGDEKPQFAIAWNEQMLDETDTILNNSGNLPVVFPYGYRIKNKSGEENGIFDLVDDKGETVGQVAKLAPIGDKPEFQIAWTFKMKDYTKK